MITVPPKERNTKKGPGAGYANCCWNRVFPKKLKFLKAAIDQMAKDGL